MKEIQFSDDKMRLLHELAGLGLTLDQMARCCGCSVSTLKRNYMDVIEEGKLDLNMTARRKLYKMAIEKSNMAALIFLLKTVCGMNEKTVVEVQQSNPDMSTTELLDQLKLLHQPKLEDNERTLQ